MIIMNLTYQQPLSAADALLEPHNQFLDHYYREGVFLASGPKEPRDGGIIIADCSYSEAETIIQSDPFYQHQIASYKLIEFKATKKQCK